MRRQRRQVTRREALRRFGAAAAGGVLGTRANVRVATAPLQKTTPLQNTAPFESTALIVRTVLEDVSPARLTGATLVHEHLSMSSRNPALAFYQDLDLMSDEVKACANDGVSCIVDTGGVSLGRRIGDLRTIAARSGMLIVAGGGVHTKPVYPADILRKSEQEIAEQFYEQATTERWGVIGEIGTGTAVPIDPDERKVLRAVARLQRRTGLAIITHVSDGCAKCALDQVAVLEDAGADLARVVVGHLNDIADEPARAPLAIARRGACLGFDHSGKPDDPRLPEYVRTILAILDAGFVDKVCLSSDFSNRKYLRKNGGPGISMMMTTFVPLLKRAGASEATLNRILVENPRRLLAFAPRPA